MGLSQSKSGPGSAPVSETPDAPMNRPQAQPVHDSPVSPATGNSQDGLSLPHNLRIGERRPYTSMRMRHDSGGFMDGHDASTTVGTERTHSSYGQSWNGKCQLTHADRSCLLRPEPDSYEGLCPTTGVQAFKRHREKAALKIICPRLMGALRRATIDYPSISQKEELFSPGASINEPYELIFHNWRKIEQAGLESAERYTSDHVKLLLDFIRKEHTFIWEKLDEIEEGNCKMVAFEHLWLIYRPGTTVFSKDEGGWRAYKVEAVEVGTRSRSDAALIHGYYLDFDRTGKWLIPQLEVLSVPSYSSERSIGNLEVVPDWYFQNRTGLHEKLIERGRKYWGFGGEVHYQQYNGDAWQKTIQTDPVNVIVDYVTASKHEQDTSLNEARVSGPSCSMCIGESLRLMSYAQGAPHDSEICAKGSLPRAEQNGGSNRGEKDPLLFCPSRVWAFSVRHKSWQMVLPQQLSEVRSQDGVLGKLLMDSEHKEYLESMVIAHLKDRGGRGDRDIIRGNGRGLNVLLHGNPGTGKTLTAECLAEKHRVPLYMVTCGDLGIDLDVLEQRLQEALLRATNWRAILLLDEADVFVQARDPHDIRRNAIVSIFLRHLDYSEALLFMTTNRVSKLDTALESRIHMTIKLPDFTLKDQKTVWIDLIGRLEDMDLTGKQTLEDFIKNDLETLENGAYMDMNGRQIRNCLSAASALARKDNRGSVLMPAGHHHFHGNPIFLKGLEKQPEIVSKFTKPFLVAGLHALEIEFFDMIQHDHKRAYPSPHDATCEHFPKPLRVIGHGPKSHYREVVFPASLGIIKFVAVSLEELNKKVLDHKLWPFLYSFRVFAAKVRRESGYPAYWVFVVRRSIIHSKINGVSYFKQKIRRPCRVLLVLTTIY
ncbi:hypothetical protein DL770_000575 [Monosporascus sp. CRB-9-2]|nr:hypothetical protein DL770_000575 [Monosporascus sp. CRB-9-2]